MAGKSNVNPNHYKTAGRDPQGQAVLQDVERQKFKEKQAKLSRATASGVPVLQRKKKPADPTEAKDIDKNLQTSGKRGKVSMAQKRAGSRHGLDSTPSTRPVAGAYGKRKAAAGILAVREEYDSKKQPLPARRTAAKKKPAV